MDKKVIMTDQDMAIALSEMHLAELLKWHSDGEILFTDKGIDYAYKILEQHSPKEKLALLMLVDVFHQIQSVKEA